MCRLELFSSGSGEYFASNNDAVGLYSGCTRGAHVYLLITSRLQNRYSSSEAAAAAAYIRRRKYLSIEGTLHSSATELDAEREKAQKAYSLLITWNEFALHAGTAGLLLAV